MGATPEEKKKRLHEDFDIAMTEEFESEVRDMCNLSRALVDQGIEQGMKQGVEKEKNVPGPDDDQGKGTCR